MTKLRVMTIVGTRPEIIRLSRVIPKLDKYCDHFLIHTGQNFDYELNEIFFDDLEIRMPDKFLNAAGENAAETIGKVIMLADAEIEKFKPDALLLLGDTNSSLAAIAAKRRKVPIFHMEAGNRCFDLRVPEEINRRIVDHIADINLTYSEISREYLLREGIPPDQIIKTGSPMYEVIAFYREKIDSSNILNQLNLKIYQYFLFSSHREENIESVDNLEKIFQVMNTLAEKYQLPVVVSTHPRMRKHLEASAITFHPLVKFHKPFGFFDYLALQISARVVLSDSGTITEESSILNFPALNLRDVQERPEGLEEASVMFVGLNLDRILQALKLLESQARDSTRTIEIVRDYKVLNLSEKILRIILSYTNFVDQKIWRK